MIILQFFHISTKGCLGGDHKHMSLDFRDQTGPLLRTVAFLKLGFGFFLPTSLQNLDPSDNFSIVPKKKNSSDLIFQQTWTQNGRFGFQPSLGGSGGVAEIQCKWNIPKITILGLILGLLSTQTDCSLVANQNQVESVMHKFIL